MKNNSFSVAFILKIIAAFVTILLIAAICYTIITINLTQNYYSETEQKIHRNLAQHLIDEKFTSSPPISPEGKIDKGLFGDIMHEMMAVNRSIEVYLLNEKGVVLYSVVLDHEKAANEPVRVDMQPVRAFMSDSDYKYRLGTDPRDPTNQTIFSAATFSSGNKTFIVYIVLAGKSFNEVQASLFSSYFLKLGLGASVLTLFIASISGGLLIWYLTGSLRKILIAVRRFKEGDLKARVTNAEKSDLSLLATTYNEMADTMVENIEKLQSVEALRREIIANVSHDLRTPLAIMQGYIETFQMKVHELSSEEQQEYLLTVEKSIHKLSHLVNQLFEYSKLEAKQIEPIKEPFHLTELAQDIYDKNQVLAKKKNIALTLEMDSGIPLAFADISLVERAIQNLLDNAMKYTPDSGKIVFSVHYDNQNLKISIKDSGPGISQEDKELIFERFAQTQNNKLRHLGAGLGLAIVQKIMELHDSTIDVISQPKKGAEFSFRLKPAI